MLRRITATIMVLLHMVSLRVVAQTEYEIGEYPCLVITKGDGTVISDTALIDKDLTTVYRVSTPADQVIIYDWSACNAPTTVKGVLMHTDQMSMTGGTVTFSVDGVTCPDTNGVGVNGQGGVFNCGLYGSTFRLECTIACTTDLAIVELKLWKTRSMNLFGTPSILSGNSYLSTFDENAMPAVFGTGSVWSPNN